MAGLRRAVQDALRGRVASDPGLLRLRLAVRATLAVALSSAVLHVVGPAVGLPGVVAMLLGGMIGMNGAFATSSRAPRDAVLTLGGFPAAAACGAVPAALAAGHPTLELTGFVAVMVAAVYVRRRGPRWFNYGMTAWFTYFFTTFVGITLAQLPGLLVVIVSATACVALSAGLLVPDRPEAIRAAAYRSFSARVFALAATARDVLTGSIPPDRAEAQLHARSFRLVEAALILDGHLGETDADPAELRRRLLESELAAEELARAVAGTDPQRVPAGVRGALVSALQALADGRLDEARQAVREVREAVEAGVPDEVAGHLRDAACAVARLGHALAARSTGAPGRAESYEPAVDLYLGNLPGTAGTVAGVAEHSRVHWTLNARLCVQTAVAAPIALLLGRQLSEQRYYWAVLACFLVLTGTFTTGEATTKGVNRVVGTVAGLVAAPLAVHLTGHRDGPVVGVMLACVFLGLYFFRVSYAVMAFAVTVVMGELYDVLHEFSDSLLLLRLTETVLGAAVGVLVVLVVLPIRTADARAAAQTAFLGQVAELVGDVRDRLGRPGRTPDLLYAARRVDAQLHQLALASRPGAGATLTGLSRRSVLQAVAGFTEVAYRARLLASVAAGIEPGSRPSSGSAARPCAGGAWGSRAPARAGRCPTPATSPG